MVEIVAAAAAVHAPQLLSRPPHEDPVKLDASTDALRELGAVLDQTAPDAVLLIGLDHLETLWLEAVPAFTVVLSPTVEARYTDMTREARVHTDLAIHLLKGVVERDFDLTYSQHAIVSESDYRAEFVRDRAVELREAGTLVKLWRVPGSRDSIAIYRAEDATALHEALSSLPSFPWMTMTVEALATHPQEAGEANR